MFALIGLVEEESVMEDECALAYSRFVANLAPTPLAPEFKGGTGPGNCFPFYQGENRNQKLASPKDKSSSLYSPQNIGGLGG
jgi:hypothetical protein